MKHSKLPFKVDDASAFSFAITDSSEQFICALNWCTLAKQPAAKERADFIINACNQHDTLKAKAELFDKVAIRFNNSNSDLEMISTIMYIQEQAKELTR